MEEITFANSTNQETNEQLTEQPSKSMMLCYTVKFGIMESSVPLVISKICQKSVIFRIPIYRGDKYGIFGTFDPYLTKAIQTFPEKFKPKLGRSLYLKRDFGTLQLNSQLPTVCNTAGRLFTSDVFWDPPIVAGDPNLAGYTVTLPGTVTAINLILIYIDYNKSV
ncbi:unnamed protein product [Rhizophagus irregularis]|uniref:Uncharacterized protein n=1 Tax=Rhizophagus irregularis TaxID=588596 RepID=A0A915ZW86_9GLOM|nr:unnamed protein product [Rhizophagus irregularis]